MIQAKKLLGDSGGAKVAVGIHDDILFNGLKQSQSWWDILFIKPSTGQAIHKRLFQPTGEFQFDDETPEEALNREIETNLRHVVHLLREFLGYDNASQLEAPDYDSFIVMAADYLDQFIGERVNLKVIPDRKLKYPDLGRYPNYVSRWFEGEDQKLKFSKRELELVDKYVKETGETVFGTGPQSDVDEKPSQA